jgi:SP family myo-inositol transporter-like MFS transporter 13
MSMSPSFTSCIAHTNSRHSTGVISSTLVSIHNDLSNAPLSTLSKSLITSSTSLFALCASPATGFLADRLGRKPVLLLASCLFIIGALAQAVSTTVWAMIIGRSVVGLAIGSASFVAPLYISELAPRKLRGRLVVVQVLFISGGQVVAYVVGWALSTTSGGWRWMVGLGALPAMMQLVLLAVMPESPRWLFKRGHVDQAEAVLKRVYASSNGNKIVQGVLRAIQKEQDEEADQEDNVENEDRTSPRKRSTLIPRNIQQLFSTHSQRRALAIACFLQGAQQLCGFNSVMYFAATIFSLAGFHSPTLPALTIALTNFLFTFIALYAIDYLGRRRILLYAVPFMALGLALCAAAFSFLDSSVNDPSSNSMNLPLSTMSSAITTTQASTAFSPATLLLPALLLYVATYALSLGSLPWLQSELFPTRTRAVGAALATTTNWTANTIVAASFLPALQTLGPAVTFAGYAGVCVVVWLGVAWGYPEVGNSGLEEVQKIMEGRWRVW